MRFDPSQPADQVFGLPGVAWSQAGRCFDPHGRHVTWRREMVTDDLGEQREVVIVERVEGEPEPEPEVVFRPRPDDPRSGDMHWTALKTKLAMFDEPYTTKEAALAFLAGKGVQS